MPELTPPIPRRRFLSAPACGRITARVMWCRISALKCGAARLSRCWVATARGKLPHLRSIARMAQPSLSEGEMHLEGVALHPLSSWQASRLGVNLVQEDRRIIAGLTVEENLLLSQIAPPVGWPLERIYEHFPRLAERRKQDGVTLSGGEQQMLAIARALAREVKLLLLDEPYEGLAPVIVAEIERILEGVKRLNLTTLLVEQNAVAALRLADRAIILSSGEIVFDGAAAEVLNNKAVRQEYLAI